MKMQRWHLRRRAALFFATEPGITDVAANTVGFPGDVIPRAQPASHPVKRMFPQSWHQNGQVYASTVF